MANVIRRFVRRDVQSTASLAPNYVRAHWDFTCFNTDDSYDSFASCFSQIKL